MHPICCRQIRKKAGMGAFGVPLADAEISGVVDTDFMPTDSGNRLLSKSNNAVTSRQNEADGGQEPDCLLECDAEVCVRDTYIDVEKGHSSDTEGTPALVA